MSAATHGAGAAQAVPDQGGAAQAGAARAGADEDAAVPTLTSLTGLARLDLPGLDLADAPACGPDGC